METKINELKSLIENEIVKIDELFKDVIILSPSMSIRVTSYNALRVSVQENVERWSSEILTVSLNNSYYNKPPVLNFNYGSGGWNSGETITQIGILKEAWTIAERIAIIITNNVDFIIETDKKINEYSRELSNIYEGINSITRQANIQKTKEEFKPFVDTLERFKSIDELLTYNWSSTRLVSINYNTNSISFNRYVIEVSKGDRTTYKLNGSRFSKKDLISFINNNILYKTVDNIHDSFYRREYSSTNDIYRKLS